jgi:hypothetical protein
MDVAVGDELQAVATAATITTTAITGSVRLLHSCLAIDPPIPGATEMRSATDGVYQNERH